MPLSRLGPVEPPGSFRRGARVRVLRGRNFPLFHEREEGVVMDVDEECRTCRVLFDGRGDPVQVAFKHIRVVPAKKPGASDLDDRDEQDELFGQSRLTRSASPTHRDRGAHTLAAYEQRGLAERLDFLEAERSRLLASMAALEGQVERNARLAERRAQQLDHLEMAVALRQSELDEAQREAAAMADRAARSCSELEAEVRANARLREELERLRRATGGEGSTAAVARLRAVAAEEPAAHAEVRQLAVAPAESASQAEADGRTAAEPATGRNAAALEARRIVTEVLRVAEEAELRRRVQEAGAATASSSSSREVGEERRRPLQPPPPPQPSSGGAASSSSWMDAGDGLFRAAAGNDVAAVTAALSCGPLAGGEGLFRARDTSGRSLLHAALASGADEVALLLLQRLRTEASRRRYLHNLQGELLQRDLHLAANCRDSSGRSPLALLARRAELHSTEVARSLLAAQADIGQRDADGRTPFLEAARCGCLSIVQLLLQSSRGAVLGDVDYAGRSALHLAAQEGRSEVVALLLRVQAEVAALDAEGRTAADAALQAGHSEVAALLRQGEEQEAEAGGPPPRPPGDWAPDCADEDEEEEEEDGGAALPLDEPDR